MKRRDTFDDAETIRICREGIDYQGIVKHINEGIVIIREGIIIFANDAFSEISCRSAEEVIKAEFASFITARDRERVAEYCTKRLFVEDLPDRIEFLLQRESGEAVIEMKSRVVECGGAPGLLGALTDITERRQTRNELQLVKERLESTLHAMNEVIVSMSPVGSGILAINPAAEALFGIPLRDFTSGERHIMDFIHPDDVLAVREFYDKLPEVEFDQAQYRIISGNRKVKWVLDEGHVVFARGGATQRIDHVIKDITEEKHAIDALRQSEMKYRDFFNSTNDMAFAITPDGLFIDINEAGLRLLGFDSKEEALVSNVGDFYVDIADRADLIAEIYGKGHVVSKHVRFKNRKGEQLEVAITARVKMDDTGQVLYHEGIVHNISKALEEQRNRVLRNAAGGLCHYLNTHLMQLNGAQKFLREDMAMLDRMLAELLRDERLQGSASEIGKIMESMQDFLLSIGSAYDRIAEVTRAFNQAFIYTEESYSTDTILDIFRSYGYKGRDE